MLKVWGRRNSINVQKAMWAIGEAGVAHQHIDAGGAFGLLDTPAFGALNPNRRVPVIDDDGTVVWESQAIVRYIAAQYGQGSLWNISPALRAQCDQWMEWGQNDLQQAVLGVFWGFWRTPEQQRNMTMINRALARAGDALRLLDAHLAGRAFIAGESFTMGDIPAGAQLFRYFELPIQRPSLPNVEAWYARLKDRPAYREHVMVSFQDMKGRTSF